MQSAARRTSAQVSRRFKELHARVPYLKRVPANAVAIILFIAFLNVLIWVICGIVLASHPALLSTAALSYTLGLRHALDADHISLIDLMTRRLVAAGQRPVTVGTFFSLGHSTIVIITSIVVAATTASISDRFDSFSRVGGIIGTSVSAAFLIFLGVMNGWILFKLVTRMRQVIRAEDDGEFGSEGKDWLVTGGGPMFRMLSKLFRVVDRPWKLYPLGVLFGLGFDTSSEIALLGITSIHAVQGTSIWLIMLFPVLFTAGMCLIDTTDGGLMLTLYTWHDEDDHLDTKEGEESTTSLTSDAERGTARSLVDQEDLEMEPHVSPNSNDISKKSPAYDETADPALDHVQSGEVAPPVLQPRKRQPDPLIFLYYSTILTGLTVIVALVIGIIQLLSLILNVAEPTGKFWDGVAVAGDYYDVIGGSICGLFLVVGIGAIWFYARFKRWVHATREANIARRFRETSQRQEADEEMDLSTGPDAGQFPQIKPKNLEGEADTNVVLYS